MRLLKCPRKLTEPDFALLAVAFNRTRTLHPFSLTAWVFLLTPGRRRSLPSISPTHYSNIVATFASTSPMTGSGTLSQLPAAARRKIERTWLIAANNTRRFGFGTALQYRKIFFF